MDKQIVIYVYSGILFSDLKKKKKNHEWVSKTLYWVKETKPKTTFEIQVEIADLYWWKSEQQSTLGTERKSSLPSRELSGLMDIVHILIEMLVTQRYKFIKFIELGT